MFPNLITVIRRIFSLKLNFLMLPKNNYPFTVICFNFRFSQINVKHKIIEFENPFLSFDFGCLFIYFLYDELGQLMVGFLRVLLCQKDYLSIKVYLIIRIQTNRDDNIHSH